MFRPTTLRRFIEQVTAPVRLPCALHPASVERNEVDVRPLTRTPDQRVVNIATQPDRRTMTKHLGVVVLRGDEQFAARLRQRRDHLPDRHRIKPERSSEHRPRLGKTRRWQMGRACHRTMRRRVVLMLRDSGRDDHGRVDREAHRAPRSRSMTSKTLSLVTVAPPNEITGTPLSTVTSGSGATLRIETPSADSTSSTSPPSSSRKARRISSGMTIRPALSIREAAIRTPSPFHRNGSTMATAYHRPSSRFLGEFRAGAAQAVAPPGDAVGVDLLDAGESVLVGFRWRAWNWQEAVDGPQRFRHDVVPQQ